MERSVRFLQKHRSAAERFDAGIPLEGITQGANNEIFQGNIPVLTGIDTAYTYVYLLSETGNRSADTWQLCMEGQKEQGLRLEEPDIFHKLRPIGAEVARLEWKAEKPISDETGLEKRACGKRPQKKTLEQL